MTREMLRLVLVTALLTMIAAAGTGREALASEEGEGAETREHLEFSHPLVSNTPQPETYVRFVYDYFNEPRHEHEPGADRHSLTVGAEYAPIRSFSLELFAPYTFLNPDEGSSTNRLDNLELSWNLSFLYRITDRFHYLVEFDGQHVFGGEEDGFDMVNISPGIKYQVLKSKKLFLGASVRLPLTQDKEFYVAPRFSVFYHF